MAVYDLFSKRQKKLRGEVPDVYVYDNVPERLRVQLVQTLVGGIGGHDDSRRIYEEIARVLYREYGVFYLYEQYSESAWKDVSQYLLKTENIEHVIDIVELGLRCVDEFVRERLWENLGCLQSPDDTIAEVNIRFREHGVGYEYVSGQMIRIDSQLVHEEVVKPALSFLANPKFAGANDEFLKAHEHYRHRRYKECLAECLKAFESTMKTICEIRKWKYQASDTAKRLIEICKTNGLFETFMQSHMEHLCGMLESGVPTARNKRGGHGQGSSIVEVSESMARFVLNSTAATILLFVESIESKYANRR